MKSKPRTAIEPVALDHVVIRVTDVSASLRFYREVLGCQEERRIDTLGLIQLRCGASLIDLVDVESPLGRAGGHEPDADHRNMDHFAIALAHFDEAAIRAHLEGFSVAPGDVASRYGAGGQGPSMYIRDPDGNTVELKGPPSTPDREG